MSLKTPDRSIMKSVVTTDVQRRFKQAVIKKYGSSNGKIDVVLENLMKEYIHGIEVMETRRENKRSVRHG